MIIPIGHESSEVRRLPWVTLAIMATCTLLLLHTQSEESAIERELATVTEEIGSYVQQHPWLEVDPRAADLLFAGYGEEERQELLELWADGLEEPFDFEIDEQQRELDALTERFVGVYDSHPYRELGFVPAEISPTSLLTHQFVHGGWLHLIGNLFLLFLAGACIEDVWGRPLFASFYLLSGVAGAGLFALRYPELTMPLVGASGAVSGVLGAFLVRYWSTRIKFLFWIGLFYRGTFFAPAWLMLPLWFANELASAYLMDALLPGSGGGGIAHWAHIGGFLFGVGGAFAIRKLGVEEHFIAPVLERKTSYVRNAALEHAATLRAAGNGKAAFDTLSAELRAQPANYDVALALWDVAVELGRARDAAPGLARVIRDDVQQNEALRALSRLDELDAHVPGALVEPLVLLRLAGALAHAGRADAAPRVLRRAVPDTAAPLATAVALRIANTARSLDPTTAARAAKIALGARDLDPRERPNLEAIAGMASEVAASAPSAQKPRPTATRAIPIELPQPSAPAVEVADDEAPAPAPEEPAEKPAWSLEEDDAGKLFDLGRTIDLSVEDDPAPAPVAAPVPVPAPARAAAPAPKHAPERPAEPVAAPRPQTHEELSDASALDLSGDDPAGAQALELGAPGTAPAAPTVLEFDFQDASVADMPRGGETRVIRKPAPVAPGGTDDRTRALPRESLRKAAAAPAQAPSATRPTRAPASEPTDFDLSDDALDALTAEAERALDGGAGFLRTPDEDDKE